MKRLAGFFVLGLILFAVIGGTKVWAAADISRSFLTNDTNLVAGDLASTEPNDHVTSTNTSNAQQLVGVVIAADSSSVLAIDTTKGERKAQVAISGIVDVFVSTLAGDIHAGDPVVVSPLSGIGMETQSNLRSIGIAQADFKSATKGAKAYDVKDISGKSQRVYIGVIPVLINIGNSPATGTQSGLVGSLQTLAEIISGHRVSALQAILSFLVTVIALASLIALVYGAIHASIVAIGRNPLARGAIYKTLLQVIGMALLIVIVAIAILYLTLR